MNPLNVGKLQAYIDSGRLDASETITLKQLADCGIAGRFKHGVKLLGEVSATRPYSARFALVFASNTPAPGDRAGQADLGGSHRGFSGV